MGELELDGYTKEEAEYLFAGRKSLDKLPSLLETIDDTDEAMQSAIRLCAALVFRDNDLRGYSALQQLSSAWELSTMFPEETYVYVGGNDGTNIVGTSRTIYIARKGIDALLHPVALSSTLGEHATIDSFRVAKNSHTHLEPLPGVSLEKVHKSRPTRRGPEYASHSVTVAYVTFDAAQQPLRHKWPMPLNIAMEFNALQKGIREAHRKIRASL